MSRSCDVRLQTTVEVSTDDGRFVRDRTEFVMIADDPAKWSGLAAAMCIAFLARHEAVQVVLRFAGGTTRW